MIDVKSLGICRVIIFYMKTLGLIFFLFLISAGVYYALIRDVKIPDIEPQTNIDYTDAINLVTENSTSRINCGKKSKHYRDYLEFIDTELDTEIENLTLKNANM